MIYINEDSSGHVTLAGQVINQYMVDQGYVEYNGIVPTISDFQHYIMQNGALVVVNDDEDYTEHLSNQIQLMLDTKAKELRYDNMLSARAVAGIPLSGSEPPEEVAIHNEAIKLSRWYLACWGKATEIENDVVNQVVSRPTIQEALDLMPVYS